MLTPQQVIDSEYLESRCALLDIAAMFDRYDLAVTRTGDAAQNIEKLEVIRNALALLANPEAADDRAEQLLNLFASV